MRRIASIVLLALAGLAAPGRAWSAPSSVRLIAPAAGAELVAGSQATLEWEAPELLAGPTRIVEWEAFLSLDGGRSWPLRLTPHLDIRLRRFSFRVPAFPSPDARLLLRMGDEREEREVEIPGRFTISAPHPVPTPELLQPGMRLARGEAARPGDRGVVLWMEGTRDGAGLRVVATEDAGTGWRRADAGRPLLLPLVGPGAGRAALPPPESAELGAPERVRERAPASAAAPRPGGETRVLIHRYNE